MTLLSLVALREALLSARVPSLRLGVGKPCYKANCSSCWVVVVLSLSRVWLRNPMDCNMPGFLILHYLPELALTHVHWVNDLTISSSVIPFSSWPHSFPASGSFPVSWLFTSGGQNVGASALASILPMNIQGWFPLRLPGLIFLLSKELSWVFSRTTFQKHQCFGAQPYLWSNSHICTWLLEKP